MDEFEHLILRWVCLFDDFKDTEWKSIQSLVSSTSFKEFVDNVFCLKCSLPMITDDEKLYNTIKGNYHEFEVQKYEELLSEENSFYTCVVVFLHALLKCTNNKFRNQLSERMNTEQQILLAKFLESTQSSLFTKQNISESLLMINDVNNISANVSSDNCSEMFSNNITPIKSKRRSYLQEFCESPKSKSLIYQEKEKIISKLTEDLKNECEENYKMAENFKTLEEQNTKLSNKIEDKDKIIKFLKDEIEELSKPKESPVNFKVDNTLIIKKLDQDILDLEINNSELRQQIMEFENKHKDLNEKFGKKDSAYENLLLEFCNIETENITLKENIDILKEKLQLKETEIISLKDELSNKSVSISPMNSSCQEAAIMPSNTLFDELSCYKLEEATHDKEKYRHKYKSIKKDLINTENHVKDLDKQIKNLKKQLNASETNKDELTNKFSIKKKELQESQKKNNNLEIKIKQLKDVIKERENKIELMSIKLKKRENQIEEIFVEIDSIKKAKSMIELILTKTNTEIEALHEENDKNVKSLLTKIEEHTRTEELSQKSIADLKNHIETIQNDLANKGDSIIFYEEKMAENYQSINTLEIELQKMYQEKLMLQSNLKDMKTENESQQKVLNDKNRELENYLEYYLNELKDIKNTKSKVEEILNCKQNEIGRQVELINYQKNIIETLQSEKSNQENIIGDLNNVLQQKSVDNNDLKEKILDSVINLNNLKEQLNSALTENTILEKNYNHNELQMKTLNEDFNRQIVDLKNTLEIRNNEINQFESDLEKLKEALEKKQNDFNEQLIITNKQIETISLLREEKYELEEKIKSSIQDVLMKENEIKSLEENYTQSKLKIENLNETVTSKMSENHILMTNIDLMTLNMKNMQDDVDKHLSNVKINLQQYNDTIGIQKDKLLKLNNYMHVKKSELTSQIDLNKRQKDCIINLEAEKLGLLEKLEVFEQTVSNKNIETMNLRKELQDCNTAIKDLEEQLGVMRFEKIMIETNLNETAKQLKNSKEQFSEQMNHILIKLSNSEEEIILLKNQSLEIKNMLKNKQEELDKQLELTLQQYETINDIKAENELLEKQVFNGNNNSTVLQAEIELLKEKLDEHKLSVVKLEKELDTTGMEKTSLETQLLDCMKDNDVIKREFDEQVNEIKNYLKDSTNENNDFKNRLTELKSSLNLKQEQFESVTEENIKLSQTVSLVEDQCINLEKKLKEYSDCLLKKEENVNSLEIQNVEYLTTNENLEKRIIEIQQTLNDKHIELENQIDCCNKQKEIIVKMNCEKESLCEKIKNLGDTLSHEEYKLNSCEEKLYNCSNSINNLENKIEELNDENLSLELQLNETIAQLTSTNKDLILKLEVKENDLIREQNNTEKQIQQSNEHMKTVSFLNTEKDMLLEKTKKLKECLEEKEIIFESLQDEVNNYKEQVAELQTQKIDLESELGELKVQLTIANHESKQQLEDMDNQNTELKESLNKIQNEIDEQSNKFNSQIEMITLLTSERDDSINESNKLKNTLRDKDSVIAAIEEKIHEHEKQNAKIESEMVDLKHTNEQLEVTNQCLTQQLEEVEKKLFDLQKELDCMQTTSCENNNLVLEIDELKKRLAENESTLAINEDKLEGHNKQYKEIECQNELLTSELNQLKCQLDNLHQESAEKIDCTNKKLREAQEQLNCKESEIKKLVELKDTSLADIYQKINDLKNSKTELEFILSNERKDFEKRLESFSNYSPNVIKDEPESNHQDSLMEVITSADTFIEQNGIHLTPVENYDDYSIIEKLKKLFETLKMFIVNIKIQGNEQAITHNEYASDEKYVELLAKSNEQLETIKRLETDMADLKAECNYKMTKVQQKTQEYVTAEYEKKFERKREQMKQFCKDLETKIHQDFEEKLKKYKEKIKKDEVHIKELGQQLWEVSDKYLRLQQKDRRDSTMSLPFEISAISQTTNSMPKLNSFTMPKSNSASQIRSLVEETTRSNQDNSKRNVPAGIGKKFSLSSGKIFPKEEDEEGEMFNHSCLADLKQGKTRLYDNDKLYNERLSELQARNSLCPPHLRSCYAVETNFLPNSSLITEEDIKTLANYSDCESENLIPNDRNKKKDRYQTSYKKPGPPTPSKNGGRASLSGNAKNPLKESKDSNTNKRRLSSTPNKLFGLFMSKRN